MSEPNTPPAQPVQNNSATAPGQQQPTATQQAAADAEARRVAAVHAEEEKKKQEKLAAEKAAAEKAAAEKAAAEARAAAARAAAANVQPIAVGELLVATKEFTVVTPSQKIYTIGVGSKIEDAGMASLALTQHPKAVRRATPAEAKQHEEAKQFNG